MIIGPLSIDPKCVQYAEYKHWRFTVALSVGDAIIGLRFFCGGFDARKYLERLDPYIHVKTLADATASELLDDSEEENENGRDDLGIDVDARKIGFKA